ncbi:MAG: hypothetical protein ACKVK4_02060 [Flavobacteriales bacterium]
MNNFFPITKAANTQHFWKFENNLKQWLSDKHKFHYIIRAKQYNKQSPSGEFVCNAQVTTPAKGKTKPAKLSEIIKSIPMSPTKKAQAKKTAKLSKKKASSKKAAVPPKWKHISGNQTERKAVDQVIKKDKTTNPTAKFLYVKNGKWGLRKTNGI